jgi:hypothetical protein
METEKNFFLKCKHTNTDQESRLTQMTKSVVRQKQSLFFSTQVLATMPFAEFVMIFEGPRAAL